MHYYFACSPKRARIYSSTVHAAANIQKWVRDAGHTLEFYIMPIADLGEARNFAATQFHLSEADVMIGLDNGVTVERDAFERMLVIDADYVAARIPRRLTNLDAFADAVRSGMSDEEAARFVATGEAEARVGRVVDADRVSAGFFLLRRTVLQSIVGARTAADRVVEAPRTNVRTYGFYDHIVDEDGRRLSEDHSFCKRVVDQGHSIKEYAGPGIAQVSEFTFAS